MQLRHYLRIVHLIGFLTTYASLSNNENNQQRVKQPLGIRLCEDICKRLIGCTSHGFAVNHLSCLINLRHPGAVSTQGYVMYTRKDNAIHSTRQHCRQISRIVKTRNNKFQCVPCSSLFHCLNWKFKGSVVQKEDRRTQLLVAAKGNGDAKIELLLRSTETKTKTSKRYRYYGPQSVRGLAYIASKRKLVIAISNLLLSAPLYDYGHVVLKKDINCLDVAVDETNNRLFFISMSKYPHFSVGRMNTDGKLYEIIISVSDTIYSITTDPKRRVLYGCSPEKIFSATYEGGNKIVFITGSAMHAMVFDSTQNTLYYHVGNQMMQINLSKVSNSTMITQLPREPWRFTSYEGVIYITYFNPPKEKNSRINVFTKNGIEEISVQFKSAVTWVNFCLVPAEKSG